MSFIPMTVIEIRQMNRERILHALRQMPRCTKADIVKETNLSMATCSTMLNEMLETGEIVKVDQTGYNIGRPAILFSCNADYFHILTLSTFIREGEDFISYVTADALGNVISRNKISVESGGDNMLEALDKIIQETTAQDSLINVVGLSVPGQVRDGFIEQCDIIGLAGVDLVKHVCAKSNLRVFVENDLNVITYYLYDKTLRHKRSFSALFFSEEIESCVGSGHIINEHLHKGATMLAGEIRYIANAFGLSPSRQHSLLYNKPKFLDFVSQMIISVACTINPEHFTLMGNSLNQSDVEPIRQRVVRIIDEKDIPEIEVVEDFLGNYEESLLRFTLDSVQFPMLM